MSPKPFRFLGREYASPIWAASGTFGWGVEAIDGGFWPQGLGALVTKGVSPLPMDGAPHPRVVESGHGVGLLNAIGLQNPGLAAFSAGYAARYAQGVLPCPVWVNVLGSSLAGYSEVVRGIASLSGHGPWLAGFELNVSCPNVDKGGSEFGSDPKTLQELVRACVEAAAGVPVMVKLSPLSLDPLTLAKAAEAGGAAALSVANTLLAGLPEPERSHAGAKAAWSLGRRFGGLSGPALKPVALRLVDQIASRVALPVCGVGGIETLRDVREYFAAGAVCVQVGTANFGDPWVCERLVREFHS